MLILEQIYPNLKNQETVLQEMIGHSTTNHRSKRSLIDGMGSILKMLFGTLDAEDAKRYDDAINNIDDNEHNLIKLLKSQSQIVKTTIRNFNNTITDLRKNKEIFNKNLENLANYTRDTNVKIFNIEMKQDLDEHLSFLTLVTTEVNNEMSMVIDAILFAKNNNIHPIIISPEQYIYELKKTVSYIPIHTQYPLDLNVDNAAELLSLVNIVSYYMNDKIVFMIKTPLIIQQSYDVYNLVPVPILNKNNTYIFILPSEKYILLSENKIHYTSLDNLNNCKRLSNTNKICPLDKPLYSVYAKDNCELSLLLGIENEMHPSCDTRVTIIKKEQWYRLENENSWLFVAPTKIISTISCKGEEPHDIDLKQTGILKLKNNCKLYTTNIILHSTNQNMMSSHLSVLPNFDIINNDCCNKLKNNSIPNDKLEFIPLYKHNMNFEDLNVASHKIDKINDILDEMNNDHFFHKIKNNTYFVFILLSLIKLIGFYAIYRLGKYLINRKFFCTPQGRLLAIEDSKTCCARITNCITLNLNKRSNNENNDIEMEEVPQEHIPLRRSQRIAQIKTQ